MKTITQQFWWFGLAALLLLWIPSTLLRLGAGHPLYADPRFDGQRFRLETGTEESGDGGIQVLELLGIKPPIRLENLSTLSFAQIVNTTTLGGRWYRVANLEGYSSDFVVLLNKRYVLVQYADQEYVSLIDPFLGQMVYPTSNFLTAWLKNGYGQLYAFGTSKKIRGN